MSYQVLARKWRPQTFEQMVGQEHVKEVLINALQQNRVHHAYLFTGTRGVGKTTIARIFSKSLNCDEGTSAHPCGKCSSCVDIEEGRFVDLIEIDAASRTKVEDTREILDNVQYKPTRGRYKVYLIDEVHMLSKHSFNALLKTLEEPPPHIKFLLATTDPQKLPITILSRCLQFNLKAMQQSQIVGQLTRILSSEGVSSEPEALELLAKAADGSMRDALSLTDQAVAQGRGDVQASQVRKMLGLLDTTHSLNIVLALVSGQFDLIQKQIDIVAQQAPDFSKLLSDIQSLMHQVAMTQINPSASDIAGQLSAKVKMLAQQLPKELVQLYYQIALKGREDMPFAPDPRSGFEMTLVRMHSFRPANLEVDIDLDAVAEQPLISAEIEQLNQQQNEILSEAEQMMPEVATPSRPQQSIDVETNIQSEFSQEPLVETVSEHVSQPLQQPEPMLQPEPLEQVQQPEQIQSTEPEQPREQVEHTQEMQHSAQSEESTQSQPEPEYTPQASMFDAPPMEPIVDVSQDYPTAMFDEPDYAEPVPPQNVTPVPEQPQMTSAPMQEDTKTDETKGQDPTSAALKAMRMSNMLRSHLKESEDGGKKPEVPLEAPEPAQEPEVVEPKFVEQCNNLSNDEIVELDAGEQKVRKAHELDHWSALVEDMGLQALTRQLAINSTVEISGDHVKILLEESQKHLSNEVNVRNLSEALNRTLGRVIELDVQVDVPDFTPRKIQHKIDDDRLEYVKRKVDEDPWVNGIIEKFSGVVIEDSIEPID